jgi:hypothetical protein
VASLAAATVLDEQLNALEARILEPVVRKALDRDGATIDDWAYVPLTHGVINPVTAPSCSTWRKSPAIDGSDLISLPEVSVTAWLVLALTRARLLPAHIMAGGSPAL